MRAVQPISSSPGSRNLVRSADSTTAPAPGANWRVSDPCREAPNAMPPVSDEP